MATKWNRNKNENGYVGSTAYITMQRVSKEERKIAMAKKRSSRRTADENIIHEKAVKMRKMTDAQLVHYVEDRVEKARSEGFNQGKKKAHQKVDITAILDEIAAIRGIGETKLGEIKTVLERRLEVF